MARKREGVVQEPYRRIQTLEKEYAGTPRGRRFTMLRLVKQNPERQIAELASEIGCSERTIKRWWKEYQEGGLELLAGQYREESESAPATDELSDLTRLLNEGRF